MAILHDLWPARTLTPVAPAFARIPTADLWPGVNAAENVTGFLDKAAEPLLHTCRSLSLPGWEASMFYIVEVGSFGGDIGAAMSNMRTWLDHQHSQPVIFRQILGDGTVFRLEFRSEAEAAAFVGIFGGRLFLPEADASAASTWPDRPHPRCAAGDTAVSPQENDPAASG